MLNATRCSVAISSAAVLVGALLISGPASADPQGPNGPRAEDRSSAQQHVPQQGDPVTVHGEQVHKTQTLASTAITSPEGRALGVYIVSGNPGAAAEVSVVDLVTGEAVYQERVEFGASAQRGIDVSTADGMVYFGTADVGHIYRYDPAVNDVEHLAAVPDGELVWSLAVGEDGTVWFGTYPTGKLYSMDPETLEVTDHGKALAGEQYVGGISPHGDTVFVGTQPKGRVLSFDRSAGEFMEIPMPDGRADGDISEMDRHGDKLFVSSASTIDVYDIAAGQWIDSITGTNARVSAPAPHDTDLVYLRKDAQIHSYNTVTGELLGTGNRPNATPESWSWLPVYGDEEILVMTYWNGGRTYGFSFQGGDGLYLEPPLLGAGANLIALGHDTSGNVYSGAYLSPPGMGVFDPSTGSNDLLAGSGQIEGYGTFGDKLVFGRYPQGSLYLYDPAQPWNLSSNPASALEIGDGQSRPQSFVQLDEETMAVASVPTGGQHGGAITLWQPEEGTHEVHRHVVEDQTPVSIVRHGDILIGGTSIEGGYGIDPVTSNATVFGWDAATGETVWEAEMDARSISALAVADDGNVWGVADGRRVFEFDPETQSVVRTVVIDSGATIPRYGDDEQLQFDNGRLFGSTANRLFVLDQVTGEVDVLLGRESGREDGIDDVSELTIDPAGDLYVIAETTQLASYDLPDDIAAPEAELSSTRETVDGIELTVGATDEVDDAPSVQVRVAEGEWQTHESQATVLVPFGSTLEYRALDSAWNATEVSSYEAQPEPSWNAEKDYGTGDRVFFDGAVHEVAWYTQGEEPGSSAWGAWQEIATDEDGIDLWTASRIFDSGDVVIYDGQLYEAMWWTRNQAPGDRHGPWEPQSS